MFLEIQRTCSTNGYDHNVSPGPEEPHPPRPKSFLSQLMEKLMSCEGSQSVERKLQFRVLRSEAKKSSVHRKERNLGSILACGYVHVHVDFRKRSWC